MPQECRLVRDGNSGTIALQETEFMLGGQCNENDSTRLEVVLVASGATTRTELRLLGWGEGIGWYIQKRIRLDPIQIRALKRILGRGEGRMTSAAPKLNRVYASDRRRRNTPQERSVSLCS